MKIIVLVTLLAIVALSGCTTYTPFPKCDAGAPRHWETNLSWKTEQDGDAAVVAQSAGLLGWENVRVHGYAFRGSMIEGDCNK